MVRSRPRLAELHVCGEAPKAIAAILDREGFRPPKRASGFTAGGERLLRAGLAAARPRRRRPPRSCPRASGGCTTWRGLGLSPHTLHGWRREGWLRARQVGGRGGPWAAWADESELNRLRALRECPRTWPYRERLADLRVPGPRPG